MFYVETRDRVIFIPAAVATIVIILACFGVYEAVRAVCNIMVSIFSGSPFAHFL